MPKHAELEDVIERLRPLIDEENAYAGLFLVEDLELLVALRANPDGLRLLALEWLMVANRFEEHPDNSSFFRGEHSPLELDGDVHLYLLEHYANRRTPRVPTVNSPWRDRLIVIGGVVVVVILILCAIVGFVTIVAAIGS